jgi:hypothetical protein
MTRRILLVLLTAAALAAAACNARKDFPEPDIGWHSPNFSKVFGILRLLPGRNPGDKPTWVVIFGSTQDTYQGLLALTEPPVGYAGGEPVELYGHILDQATTDAFNGRWYVVDSIQLWTEYR